MSDIPAIHPLILVIGHSKTTQKIIEVTFRREGVSVTHYTNLAEMLSVEKYLPVPPDVVFVDLSGRHGYHLIRQLHSRSQFKQPAIIGVSHHKGIFFRLKAWCVGTDVYLTKPLTSEKLIQAVMEHSKH